MLRGSAWAAAASDSRASAGWSRLCASNPSAIRAETGAGPAARSRRNRSASATRPLLSATRTRPS